MSEFYELKKSWAKNKKYVLQKIVDGEVEKTTHFGQKGYEQFPIHKNDERQIRYIARHKDQEKDFWSHSKSNLMRPAYLSRWLTWSEPKLQDAIKFVEKKQNIDIVNKL